MVEVLGMKTVVQLGPVYLAQVSRLLPEAVVIQHPGWPAESLAEVAYIFLV